MMNVNIKRNGFLLTSLMILLLAACGQKSDTPTKSSVPNEGVSIVEVQGGSYRDVTPAGLKAMLSNKDFTFVNVHIPFEGDIASTDLSIPYDEIDQTLGKLPADKNAKVVLYCRSGYMSDIAARKLVEFGYTNVWNLSGGMVAWEKEGYPLEGN